MKNYSVANMTKLVNLIIYIILCFSYSPLLAEKTSWKGYYSGVSISENAGKDKIYLNDVFFVHNSLENPSDRNGSLSGLFLGYLLQKDELVYGAEISSSNGKIKMKNVPTNFVEDVRDFKIRIGRSYNKALLTTSLGYFSGMATPDCVATCGTKKYGGHSLGFGFDYEINKSLFIGSHYSYKVFERHKYDSGPGWGFEGHMHSLEVRAGFKF